MDRAFDEMEMDDSFGEGGIVVRHSRLGMGTFGKLFEQGVVRVIKRTVLLGGWICWCLISIIVTPRF